jgi:hypothetical protein
VQWRLLRRNCWQAEKIADSRFKQCVAHDINSMISMTGMAVADFITEKPKEGRRW